MCTCVCIDMYVSVYMCFTCGPIHLKLFNFFFHRTNDKNFFNMYVSIRMYLCVCYIKMCVCV